VHGSTHAVHFTISAERVGSSISVLADINFPFVDWNISVQGVPFLADIQSPAIVEVLLNLSKGTGNLATATTPIGRPGSVSDAVVRRVPTQGV